MNLAIRRATLSYQSNNLLAWSPSNRQSLLAMGGGVEVWYLKARNIRGVLRDLETPMKRLESPAPWNQDLRYGKFLVQNRTRW